MKTKNYIKNFKRIVKMPAVVFFLFAVNTAFAQDKIALGGSVTSQTTGSGFGSSVSPSLVLSLGRNSVTAGMNFQNLHHNLSGIRGKYEFILNPEENSELFLFYDVAYHYGAYFAKNTVAWETFISPENKNYFNGVKLRAVEQHIGFGINIRIWNKLKIFGAAGAGFYNTLDKEKYASNIFQYRELNGCTIMLMAGIKFNLKRIK